jgi:hypothetical protein
MKFCKKCELPKDITSFYKNRRVCKKCLLESQKDCHENYYLDNKDKLKDYRKEYNLENKNRRKLYNIKNKPKRKEHYNLNKELIKNNASTYYNKNKETIKEKSSIYYKNNKVKIMEDNKRYSKIRRTYDTLYKLTNNIRTLICNSIRKNGYSKKSKTFEILGCSFDEFKIYIENQFEPWMNWNNCGLYTGNYNETWQIDHIIPVSNSLIEDDVLKLNHFNNLRPLCSKKNLEKSSKLEKINYNYELLA